ncbi:MAG: IS1634 family transposase [Gammaproteobacteria bacterium]
MTLQPSINKKAYLKKSVLNAHPIIQHYIERLRIPEIIRSTIKSDQRCIVQIEQALPIVIHNYLTESLPLYEFQNWTRPLAAEALGLSEHEHEHIRDDRIGKALEQFYLGRHKDVFLRLALRAIKLFELDCSQVHQDTTTVTFCGKYAGWSAQEMLGFGHNKDHRPDLKQLVLGMTVTADGSVPLCHRVYDGNQTDDQLHPENHKRLQKLLGRTDFIYVADSKLATQDNLNTISQWGGLFVSIMPRTWKADEEFRENVRNGEVKWQHILSRANNRKPDDQMDRYYKATGDYHTSEGYQLYWIRSSQKVEQDRQTRERRLQGALEGLKELQTKLNKYKLKKPKNIKAAIDKILQEKQCSDLIEVELNTFREYKRVRKKQGRPKKDETGELSWKTLYSINFGVRQEAVKQAEKVDGIFPLITNLDATQYKAKSVLEIYKFQPFLEKRHSQIKTYQEITPVNIKKPERVVGYLHMQVMALMVSTLIERQLRLAMRRESIDVLPIYPEDRPCPHPTMFDIVRLFRGVERYEVHEGDDIKLFPAQISKAHIQVLNLLEVPLSLYQ